MENASAYLLVTALFFYLNPYLGTGFLVLGVIIVLLELMHQHERAAQIIFNVLQCGAMLCAIVYLIK